MSLGSAASQLATAIESVREARTWALRTEKSTSSYRSMDGIAEALRHEAALLFFDRRSIEEGQQGVSTFTVAAPTAGEGGAASFHLTNTTASACLAGLAALGPPGTLRKTDLIEVESSDTRLGADIYVSRLGHAIWNPRDFLAPPPGHPIECLHQNHTYLVGHIAALAAITSGSAGSSQPTVPSLSRYSR